MSERRERLLSIITLLADGQRWSCTKLAYKFSVSRQPIANYYNRDELLELFKVAKGKKIEFAVLMASYYGLRRSEIMGLKWSCVDFKEKKITIKHTVTEFSLDGKLVRVAKDRAKTKKSIRS